MRTTVNLDPDVLNAARHLAGRQRRSLGEVLSELARKGLRGDDAPTPGSRNGFPLFAVPCEAAVITPEDIKRDEDDV